MAGKSDGSNSSLRGAIATKQSTLVLRRDGLLRFARNDGENFFSVRHSGARRRREPGIHNHHREYGFRARAKAARPGMTVVGMPVIARRDSDEAIHTCLAARWIASLALAMTGKFLGPSSFEARASALAPQDDANSILYLGKIRHRTRGGADFVEQLQAIFAHF